MAETYRKLRKTYNVPGHAHALTFSCYLRQPLLARDDFRELFLENLNVARARWQFSVWAYVLMPEHAHLVVCPQMEVYDMSRILLAIKKPVSVQALQFVRNHEPQTLEKLTARLPGGRTENRFWQAGPGYDDNLADGKAIWNTIEYIHLNPVRRGLVATAPEWKWSSAAFYEGTSSSAFVPDLCEVWIT